MNNNSLHRLLNRQVTKHLDPSVEYPIEILQFIESINHSYIHYDNDRMLLERAMNLSSKELESLLIQIRNQAQQQKEVLEQLKVMLGGIETSDVSVVTKDDLSSIVTSLQQELNIKEKTHQELKENETNLKALIENTDDMILSIDTHYSIISYNSHFSQFSVFAENNQPKRGLSILEILPKSLADEWRIYFDKSFSDLKYFTEIEHTYNGEIRYFALSFNALLNEQKVVGTTLFCKDITFSRQQQLTIEKSLAEKEILLKEIHHRVKNNLQVITSLLNLQSKRLSNDNNKEYFKRTQHRIESMALIHEMLYRSSDFRSINYQQYIEEFIQILVKSYNNDQQTIHTIIDTGGLMIEMEIAIPLGLIINEIVSNSLKHGIKDRGTIEIRFTKIGEMYTMLIGDDGIGIQTQIASVDDNQKLGLKLVEYLTEQIDSECTLLTDRPGTYYTFTFLNTSSNDKSIRA